jgi:quercetin dioxygenase-like cupin family protein
MDVTNASSRPATIEHGGTCITNFLIDKEELRKDTSGGYLEFVSEFQLKAGASLEPHSHESDEFYYLLEGEAIMTVGGEERTVRAGDLIRTPPNTVHSIRTVGDGAFRAFAFATSYMPAGHVGYTVYPEGREPEFVPHDLEIARIGDGVALR